MERFGFGGGEYPAPHFLEYFGEVTPICPPLSQGETPINRTMSICIGVGTDPPFLGYLGGVQDPSPPYMMGGHPQPPMLWGLGDG